MLYLQEGFEIMIIGMLMVLVALYGLALVMMAMAKIFGRITQKEPSVETLLQTTDVENDEELVAVVSAVAAVTGTDKIASIKIVN